MKRYYFQIIILFALIFSCTPAISQTAKSYIRNGNKQYDKKKFNDAEVSYRKSLEQEHNNATGNFNLGDALYKQGNYEKAAEQFSIIANNKEADKNVQTKAYHNLGNSLLKSGNYQQSIDAYKRALINNPSDMDTKYNLAYAQSMLKQQQQQKNKDQQNKDQQNKDQQNKDQQNKDQQKKDKQEQNQAKQDDKSKISKEDAKRILQALNNEEKRVQDKLKKKLKVQKVKIEKQW